jgi:hypothetical protein
LSSSSYSTEEGERMVLLLSSREDDPLLLETRIYLLEREGGCPPSPRKQKPKTKNQAF